MSKVNVTIKFGVGNSCTLPFDVGTTVGDVVGNDNVRGILGLPENCTALINGAQACDGTQVAEGMVISVETRANSKA